MIEHCIRDEFEDASPYATQLETMDKLLQFDDVLDEEVQKNLGNSVAALYSVPTAVFCFLHCQKPIPNIKVTCVYQHSNVCCNINN